MNRIRSPFLPLIIAVALAGIVASCGVEKNNSEIDSSAPGSAQTDPNANVSVSIPQGATGMGPAAYGINPLVVNVGTTVTWTNNDSAPHDVTSDTDDFASGTLTQGQIFSHTFDTAGTYPYHCTIHGQASMSGVVQVNGASPGPGVTPGASPTEEPSPAAEPSPPPSPSVSATPAVSPTATPTEIPTATPTTIPTSEPTGIPTSTPVTTPPKKPIQQ